MSVLIDQAQRDPHGGSTGIESTTSHTTVAPIVIQPSRGWSSLQLRELWEYRELLYFLVWRDLKVRYKQTALGAAWVVLQPLAATLIFTVIFGRLVGVPSNDLPYAVFAFAALLPWNYFASSLNRAGTSLVGNAHLVTKIFFPRLIIPLSGVVNGLVDFSVSFVVLLGLMAFYGVTPGVEVFFLPLFLLLALGTALGTSLWLSSLNVRYRDVTQMLPVLAQMWMYASPIVYPSSLIPEPWQPLYALNPMVGVVEGFRWALTGRGDPPGLMLGVSALIVIILLVSGLAYFHKTEQTFADII